MEHLVVYGGRGEFCGWPANHGAWQWGDEILVGFLRGVYRQSTDRHSIDFERDNRVVLARSVDRGQTWCIEAPSTLIDRSGSGHPCPGGTDFKAEGFILRCNCSDFQVSADWGRTWQGPYVLPDVGLAPKARTDYIVSNRRDCLLFIAAFDPVAGHDRAMCMRAVSWRREIRAYGMDDGRATGSLLRNALNRPSA